jgi:hypothetical protein
MHEFKQRPHKISQCNGIKTMKKHIEVELYIFSGLLNSQHPH